MLHSTSIRSETIQTKRTTMVILLGPSLGVYPSPRSYMIPELPRTLISRHEFHAA